MKRLLALVTLLLAAGIALAACGGGSSHPASCGNRPGEAPCSNQPAQSAPPARPMPSQAAPPTTAPAAPDTTSGPLAESDVKFTCTVSADPIGGKEITWVANNNWDQSVTLNAFEATYHLYYGPTTSTLHVNGGEGVIIAPHHYEGGTYSVRYGSNMYNDCQINSWSGAPTGGGG